jgi:4-diphosphocytidyl-2-C-methyl-D-erythritol kinase
LKITGRRPDGYHELVSIMVPVDLFDRLELKFHEEPDIRVTCRGFPAPANADNLVWRAAQAFFSQIGWPKGISISLTKRIPIAAGLGGGSSDAAAVLMALNETLCASEPLPLKILAELALKLGADVPFFLQRKACIAHGIGERLKPLQKWPPLPYVIVMPEISVSTPWAYETLDKLSPGPLREERRELELTTDNYYYMIRNSEEMPMAACRLLENDLEQVTAARFPIIGEIKRSLEGAGAIGALMSGSGPSVFGIFESGAKAVHAKSILDAASLGKVFVVTGINSWGVVKW